MRFAIAAGMLLTLATAPSLASSGDAWEEFAADVSASCLSAAAPMFDAPPHILVEPYGSESFGLALILGQPRGGGSSIAVICVYDKQTGAVEVGGELPSN